MNPNTAPTTSIHGALGALWANRQLISQMVKREVLTRYKGSAMGLLWAFVNPLLMLAIYTFVFSEVFKTRWGAVGESEPRYAVVLFAGLIIFSLFSEVVTRAPSLILSNTNYVKKVVFPLEILPVVQLGASSFHAFVGVVALLTISFLLDGRLPATSLLLPIVLLPLLALTLGIGWILASLGVYVRDVNQTVVAATSILLFMSPVFFPVSALPSGFQIWMSLNPLTFIIEQTRQVLVWGNLPDWRGLFIYSVVAIAIMWLGFVWFQRTRRGFSDVL